LRLIFRRTRLMGSLARFHLAWFGRTSARATTVRTGQLLYNLASINPLPYQFLILSSAFQTHLQAFEPPRLQHLTPQQQLLTTQCPVEERVERVWVRVEPSDTERCCETTSRVSPSPQSDDWHDEVVSSEYSLRHSRSTLS
jgi:hypothetical protein